LLVSERFDSLSLIGRVTAPLFVMQAEDDSIVPARFGHALYAAARGPKESLFAPQGGHLAGNYGGVDAAIAFLQRRIGARARGDAAQ
jgi:fermentation-respiration switch protein FrsA (DUF1100 family)